MTTLHPSPIPLYHQVFAILRQRVLDGTYNEGDQFAPEDELAAEFDVSRATIRQAVGELVSSGLVSRKQGRGTFVLPAARSTLGQRFRGSLADLIAETRRAKVRSIEMEHDARIPAHIAELLQLEEAAGTIVRRSRIMDGEPFAHTVNYLPPAYGKLIDRKSLTRGSLMGLLESKGVRFSGGTQSIRAQLADTDTGTSLGIGFGAPVLFVERLLLGPDGEPVEVVRSWYRGDHYEYTVTFGDLGGSSSDMKHQFA